MRLETSIISPPSWRVIEAELVRSCSLLLEMCGAQEAYAPELREKFSSAVADISAVKIIPIAEDFGAFRVSDGILLLDEAPIAKIYAAVVADVKAQMLLGRQLSAADFSVLILRTMRIYAYHELRHRSQGVERFSIVQELKAIAGSVPMAELDVVADRDAAFACAIVDAGMLGRRAILEAFAENLFFSFSYFFRVFPLNTSKPEKVARAIALLLMIARLTLAFERERFIEDPSLPLDSALVVRLEPRHVALAVFKPEPSMALLTNVLDERRVGAIVSAIHNERFDDALKQAIVMVRTHQLLRIRDCDAEQPY